MELNVVQDAPVISKIDRANSVVIDYAIVSMGVGFVPVPLADLAALTGVQFKMLHGLAKLYDIKFSQSIGKSLITSLMGGAVPTSMMKVMSVAKLFPGIGTVAGIAGMSLMGGAATYALGKVFVRHFESGGIFENFDPKAFKKLFTAELKAGKKIVAQLRKDFTPFHKHEHVHEDEHEHGYSCSHSNDHNHETCDHPHTSSHEHHEHSEACDHTEENHQSEGDCCGHTHSHDQNAINLYRHKVVLGGTTFLGIGAQKLFFPALIAGSVPIFVIAGSVAVITGFGYLRGLWSSVTRRKVNTDTLVGTSIVASLFLGDGVTSLAIIFLLNTGEYLQALTLRRTDKAINDLLEIDESKEVWLAVSTEAGEAGILQPLSRVKPQDTVIVYEGNSIPVDGVILEGQGTVNEAPITGEEIPVVKHVGDDVYAGTLLLSNKILVRVERIGNDTVVGRIIQRVDNAAELRPRIQTVGDRFSLRFVPAAFALSGLVFLVTFDPYRALTMLLIACPCAVGLSTPTAVSASIGNGARKGILIRGGTYLETAAEADIIVFDKTGTLTSGLPTVMRIVSYADGYTENKILSLAATAELHSNHPLGGAVVNHARQNDISIVSPESFDSLSGCGMRAEYADNSVLVGNTRLMNNFDVALPAEAEADFMQYMKAGEMMMYVVHQGRLVGLIGVRDNIRPGVSATIERLRARGFDRIMMFTGDHEVAAKSVAKTIGIDEWHAQLLPEQKHELIRKLQAEGHKVIMIGDGINDAPALALADVGIAIGVDCSDAAIESADITLASEDFGKLETTIQISKKTIRLIRQNYGMALGINASGLVAGALGMLNPLMAVVLHNASTMAVLINSSKLIRYNPKQDVRPEDAQPDSLPTLEIDSHIIPYRKAM